MKCSYSFIIIRFQKIKSWYKHMINKGIIVIYKKYLSKIIV